MLAASGVCGASCSELELEAAAHGGCVAHKRQLHLGCFLVLASGAVIKILLVSALRRRRAGRGERAWGRRCGGMAVRRRTRELASVCEAARGVDAPSRRAAVVLAASGGARTVGD